VCLCDTVGHATPTGVRRLVGFVKARFPDVLLDWHGHEDRGLSLANALAAVEAGVDRVHGTVLGIGERCGNTPMEQLLLNLFLLGDDRDISALPEYCWRGASVFGRPIPVDYPIVGRDAFRTASGVHAAAIAKAQRMGDPELADRVYSSVPAAALGLSQRIEVGPMSGRANVRHWLDRHGIPVDGTLLDGVLRAAREADRVLSETELRSIVMAAADSL
jgi:2-isopropylmalate synthase